jgi:hypothetical protein
MYYTQKKYKDKKRKHVQPKIGRQSAHLIEPANKRIF